MSDLCPSRKRFICQSEEDGLFLFPFLHLKFEILIADLNVSHHLLGSSNFLRAIPPFNTAHDKTKTQPGLKCSFRQECHKVWQTKVHSYHLTTSCNPQFLRTRAVSENKTCLSTTQYFNRCDSLSPHLFFHLTSHCALKFQVLLFCSQCWLLCAALPPLEHSFLHESQDFPAGAHIILLLICTVVCITMYQSAQLHDIPINRILLFFPLIFI